MAEQMRFKISNELWDGNSFDNAGEPVMAKVRPAKVVVDELKMTFGFRFERVIVDESIRLEKNEVVFDVSEEGISANDVSELVEVFCGFYVDIYKGQGERTGNEIRDVRRRILNASGEDLAVVKAPLPVWGDAAQVDVALGGDTDDTGVEIGVVDFLDESSAVCPPAWGNAAAAMIERSRVQKEAEARGAAEIAEARKLTTRARVFSRRVCDFLFKA